MRHRRVKVGKCRLVALCPHLTIVIAEHHRPLDAEVFHNGRKHFACFEVVARALQKPRHGIHHISRYDDEVGLCVLYDFAYGVKRKFVFLARRYASADMDIRKLQNAQRLPRFFYYDFSAVTLFKYRRHITPFRHNRWLIGRF